MDYKFTKAVFTMAVLSLSTVAVGQTFTGSQDWTGATETLYFEYDKAAKRSAVDTTKIREVLQSCSVSSISITGHTDTSGNAQYNQGLSQRRAERIKSDIVAWNILDANSISTRGAGENELALYTEDGVKEALNRRAEIQFGFSQPCGIYYTAPVETVAPVETITYSEPVVYAEPAPVYQPAPVVQAPAPVVQAPAPVVQAPPPVAPAPPPPPPPVAAPSAGFNVGSLIVPALAAGAVAVGVIVATDGDNDDDDDDDAPVSP